MKLSAWVVRSGDVIEWEGEIYSVSHSALASGPRAWGEVEMRLRKVYDDGKRDSHQHTVYASEGDKFRAVRIRNARYTADQYRELMDGGYDGQPY